MELPYDAEQLQRIAEFHQEQARLRTLARASIVWGIINVLIGVSALSQSFINIILVLIGLFLFLEGVWFSVRPSAAGILVDALVLLLIGTWNLFIVALDMLAGVPPRFFWAVLGFIFIGIAVYRLLTFPRLHQLFQEPIAEEDLRHMDELIRYLSKTKPKEAGDIIALQMKQKQWRTYLGPHYALFLDVVRKKVMVAGRSDVSIEERGKVLIGSTLKVRVQIRDKRWDGLMSPAAFAKFQAWKLSDEPGTAPELPPSSASDAYTRRDQIQ